MGGKCHLILFIKFGLRGCVIVNGLDDKRAKILSVNLNSMMGETVPSLLSKLLTDLHVEMPLDDMQAAGWSMRRLDSATEQARPASPR